MNEQASILVVDDEPSVCIALQGVLLRQGYEVTTAPNGPEALRLLEKGPVDLALVDLKMDEMDGLQLMTEIKQRWPDTLVIILTGFGTLESALGALRQGAHDYLLKPTDPKNIIASVEKGLERKRQERRRQMLLERIEADLVELKNEMPQASTSSQVASATQATEEPSEEQVRILRAGPLIMDLDKYAAYLAESLLPLTSVEFLILANMMRRKGQVVKCATLVKESQGYECDELEARSIIKTHVSHIRAKIRDILPEVDYIVNVRGVGYMFMFEEEEDKK